MATVFKPAGRAKYVILYIDENGRRRKTTGATDKAVSRADRQTTWRTRLPCASRG